jgi:hypothetical protein
MSFMGFIVNLCNVTILILPTYVATCTFCLVDVSNAASFDTNPFGAYDTNPLLSRQSMVLYDTEYVMYRAASWPYTVRTNDVIACQMY